jgi:hypothetical protein
MPTGDARHSFLPLSIRAGGLAPEGASVVSSMESRRKENPYKLPNFIEQQLPDFVTTEYPEFVMFLKSYFEFMEETDRSPGRAIDQMRNYGDIDKTIDEFTSNFRDVYLKNFPVALATGVSFQNVLKNIKDFYRAKGTEDSFKFLMAIVFGVDLDFYYPKEDILRASDGNYVSETSIICSRSTGETLFSAENTRVIQQDPYTKGTSASARIVRVEFIERDGVELAEIFVDDVRGDFVLDFKLTFTINGLTYKETLFNTFSNIKITAGGLEYKSGDVVKINSSIFKNFEGRVSKVGINGNVKGIEVIKPGKTFTSSELPLTINSSSGSGFSGSVQAGVLNDYPEYFADSKGMLSSTNVLQDNNYYQVYSYVLKAEISLNKYKDIFKKIIHPAGMKMFGQVDLLRTLDWNENNFSMFERIEIPVIGHYTPYKFSTEKNLRDNEVTSAGSWLGATGDLYPLGYNPIAATGPTGSVFNAGNQGITFVTVPESGITSHDPLGKPLGSTGTEGYTSAHASGFAFWNIYHHPNTRGLDNIPAGISFDGITLCNFFRMRLGQLYRSDQGYTGATGASPNF